jgi:hypothetical protein
MTISPITPNTPSTSEKWSQENITQIHHNEICDFSVWRITRTEYLFVPFVAPSGVMA